jgi:hypothetical protein
MNSFINTIQDGVESKRERKIRDEFTFKVKLRRLQPELSLVAHSLKQLVDAKATLENGSLFQFHINKSGARPYDIILNFPDSNVVIYYNPSSKISKNKIYNGTIGSMGSTMGSMGYTLEENKYNLRMRAFLYADNEADFLDILASYLGDKLGGVGMLDKEFYSPKIQSHLNL